MCKSQLRVSIQGNICDLSEARGDELIFPAQCKHFLRDTYGPRASLFTTFKALDMDNFACLALSISYFAGLQFLADTFNVYALLTPCHLRREIK